MRPVATETANVVLTLEGAADLPCERVMLPRLALDPDPEDQVVAFETTWLPEEGELRALANGAPVLLHVWGDAHPPVAMHVGTPTEAAVRLYDEARVMRSFAQLLDMHDRLEGGWPDDPGAMLELVRDALAATADEAAHDARMEALRRRLAP